MADAGTLTVRLGADVTGLRAGMASAAQSVQQAGAKMQRAGAALTKAVTVPLTAIGVGAVKSFGDFDQAMIESTAIMGDVSNALRTDMAQAAEEVSRTTQFAAKEAAEAYYFLASAGLDAAESIEALPSVAAFAQAGMFDLSRATDLSTDAMTALGLEVEDLGRVTDVLVRANTLANASVEQFSTALTNKAGPAMRGLGIEIEEGVAVLAAFADQGLKGQRAGTILAMTIRQLQQAATKNADAFKAYNIQIYDSQGNFRNLADIAEDFEQSLGTLSDQQKASALEQLGINVRARQGISILSGVSDEVRRYEAELRVAGDTTQRVADRQMQSFNAKLDVMKNRVVNVARDIGDNLAGAFLKLGQRVVPVVERFSALDEAQQSMAVAAGALATAFGPTLLVLGKVVSALGGMSTVITGLVGTGGAIAALAAGAGLVVTRWDEVSRFFDRALPQIERGFEESLGAITGLWDRWGDDVVASVEGVAGLILVGFEKVARWFDRWLPSFQSAFSSAISTVSRLWDEWAGTIGMQIDANLTRVIDLFDSAFGLVKDVLTEIVSFATKVWDRWGDNVLSTLRTAWQAISNVFINGGALVMDALTAIIDFVRGDFQGAWENTKDFFKNLWEFLSNGFLQIGDLILNTLEAAFDWVPVIGPAIAKARSALSNMIDERMKAQIEADGREVGKAIGKGLEVGRERAEEVGEGVEEGIGKGMGGAEQIVEDSSKGMSTIWGALQDKAQQMFSPTGDGIGGSAKAGASAVKEAMGEAGRAVQDFSKKMKVLPVAAVEVEGSTKTAGEAVEEWARSADLAGASTEELARKAKQLRNEMASTQAFDRFAGAVRGEIGDAAEYATRTLLGSGSLSEAVGTFKDTLKRAAIGEVSEFVGKLVRGEASLTGALGKAKSIFDDFIGTLTGGGGLSEAFGDLGGVLTKVAGKISGGAGLSGITESLGEAMGGLASPIGAAVLAVKDWSSVLSGGSSTIGGLIEKVTGLGKTTSNVLSALGPAFAGVVVGLKAVGVDVNSVLHGIVTGVQDVGKKITGFFGGLFGGGSGSVTEQIESSKLFTTLERNMGDWAESMDSTIISTMRSVAGEMGTTWEEITAVMIEQQRRGEISMQDMTENLRQTVENAAKLTKGYLIETGGYIGPVIDQLGDFGRSIEAAYRAGGSAAQGFTEEAVAGFHAFVAETQAELKKVQDALKEAYEAGEISASEYEEAASAAAERASQKIKEHTDAMLSSFTEVADEVAADVELMAFAFQEGFAKGSDAAEGMSGQVKLIMGGAVAGIQQEMQEAQDALQQAFLEGEISAQEFEEGATAAAEEARSRTEAIFEAMGVDVGTVYQQMRQAAIDESGPMYEAMEEASGATAEAWEAAKAKIVEEFSEMQQASSATMTALGESVSTVSEQAKLLSESAQLVGTGFEEARQTGSEAMRALQEVLSDVQAQAKLLYEATEGESKAFAQESVGDIEGLLSSAQDRFGQMQELFEVSYSTGSERAAEMARQSGEQMGALLTDAEGKLAEMQQHFEDKFGAGSREAEAFRLIAESQIQAMREKAGQYMAETQGAIESSFAGGSAAATDFGASASSRYEEILGQAKEKFTTMQELFEISYRTGSREAQGLAEMNAEQFRTLLADAETQLGALQEQFEAKYGKGSQEARTFALVAADEMQKLRAKYETYMGEVDETVTSTYRRAEARAKESADAQAEAVQTGHRKMIEGSIQVADETSRSYARMREESSLYRRRSIEDAQERRRSLTRAQAQVEQRSREAYQNMRAASRTFTSAASADSQEAQRTITESMGRAASSGHQSMRSFQESADASMQAISTAASHAGRNIESDLALATSRSTRAAETMDAKTRAALQDMARQAGRTGNDVTTAMRSAASRSKAAMQTAGTAVENAFGDMSRAGGAAANRIQGSMQEGAKATTGHWRSTGRSIESTLAGVDSRAKTTFQSASRSARSFTMQTKEAFEGLQRDISRSADVARTSFRRAADESREAVRQARQLEDLSGGRIARRAGGGPVSAGAPYLVGEVGPELFVPDMSGYVVSAAGLESMMRRGPEPAPSPVGPPGARAAGRSRRGVRQTVNVYLDGREIASSTASHLPSVLDVRGIS